jgi:hypothetical protein
MERLDLVAPTAGLCRSAVPWHISAQQVGHDGVRRDERRGGDGWSRGRPDRRRRAGAHRPEHRSAAVLRIAGFEPGDGRIADHDRRALVDALHFPMGFAWGQQVLPPTPLDPSAHSAESFDCGVDALNAWLRDRTARSTGACGSSRSPW